VCLTYSRSLSEVMGSATLVCYVVTLVVAAAQFRTVQGQNYVVVNAVGTNLIDCYECNVWKAGYGQLCDNPRIRPGCYACVKFETTIFMGYYKNTPKYTTILSRACANSVSVPFYHECQYYETVDGHSRRCYCNTPLCNSAQHQLGSFSRTAALCTLALLSVRALLH